MKHLRHSFRPLPTGRQTVLGAVAIVMLAGCADGPSAPAAPLAPSDAPSSGLLSSVLGAVVGDLASVLQRPTALSAPVQATALIGSEGGTLTLPGTGLTLRVPAGAVRRPTQFSITAPAGRGIWYEFGPSGSKFDVPLVITQALPSTLLGGLLGGPKLDAVYFADGTLNEKTGTALAKEIIPITVNATGTLASFKVTHFSGYMVSTGRQRSFSDDE
jgi:hypothetical protein